MTSWASTVLKWVAELPAGPALYPAGQKGKDFNLYYWHLVDPTWSLLTFQACKDAIQ